MKTILRITLLFATVCLVPVTSAIAQRVVKGTVYMEGEPAAGVTVEVHKGGTMMTSFDGKYELEADGKSKWIKFTFIDDSKKLEIEGKSGDVFDFALTGSIPSGNEDTSTDGAINLKSADELIAEKDMEFMNQLSLYSEFFKQEDYESLMPHWKILYEKYPKSTVNIYIHGAKLYEHLIEKAATDEEKDKLLDEYMKLDDQRIKYFGQRGYVLGRKGTAWFKYKLHESRKNTPEGDALRDVHKKGYEWISQSIKEQGSMSEPPVIVLYMQTTIVLFKLGELPKESVVMNYEKSIEICNAIVKENEDPKQVEQTKDIVIPFIETAFGKSGAADCEALVNIYTPQFEQNGEDIEFIKGMLRRLRRANCDESGLYDQATEKLYQLEPSAEAAFNMAHRYLKRGDTEKAKEYYKQAMDQETDQDLLASYYYEYGLFVFAKESAYQEARSFARKALEIKPDYCDANMLIGDIYVASTRSFQGSNIEKGAIFWLAVDYYSKARRGEDCAIDAIKKISDYKKHYPNKEDAFMEGLQEGASYKVEGWINETTKVRF